MTALASAMLLSAAIVDTWAAATPAETVIGLATYYADGVMATVAANRGLIRHPGEYRSWLADRGYAGTVALNRAGDIGRTVWLEHDGYIEGPFLSIDCAQLRHYENRLQQGRVIEVDWTTSRRWQMAGPVPVRVWFYAPHIVVRERVPM